MPALPLNPRLPLTRLKLCYGVEPPADPEAIKFALGLSLRPNAVYTFFCPPGEARCYEVGGLRRLFDLELFCKLELSVAPAAELLLLLLFIRFYLRTIFNHYYYLS